MTLIKVLINCQKRTYGFWQLIESLIKVSINWLIFRRLIEKFDQLKISSEFRSNDPLSPITFKLNDIREPNWAQREDVNSFNVAFCLCKTICAWIDVIKMLKKVFLGFYFLVLQWPNCGWIYNFYFTVLLCKIIDNNSRKDLFQV
jgi:hypothetical protein